jgi:small subunit ribosomal protein S19e
MVTAREVPPERLISELSEHLKKDVKEVKPPDWSRFVKTGSSREKPPDDPEWWYTRAASVLRKVCLNQPIGVAKLRKQYGGRVDTGVEPEHSRKGGGSNLRSILQQLEEAKLVEKTSRGRVLTPRGSSLVDRTSDKISDALEITPWYEEFETPEPEPSEEEAAEEEEEEEETSE